MWGLDQYRVRVVRCDTGPESEEMVQCYVSDVPDQVRCEGLRYNVGDLVVRGDMGVAVVCQAEEYVDGHGAYRLEYVGDSDTDTEEDLASVEIQPLAVCGIGV